MQVLQGTWVNPGIKTGRSGGDQATYFLTITDAL